MDRLTASSQYLPLFLVSGTITLLIILALGAGALTAGRRGRKRIQWQSGIAPPLPDPSLGRNRREVQLRDPPVTPRPGARQEDPLTALPPLSAPGGAGEPPTVAEPPEA